MARRKKDKRKNSWFGNNKNKERVIKKSELKSETKRAILAVFALAAGAFFVLAKVGYGGLAGRLAYQLLNQVFGWGFYLVPLLLLGLGITLLRAIKTSLVTTKVISGCLFLLALLGLVSIVGKPTNGGWVGTIIAKPLLQFFDYYGSLVFLGAVVLASLLVIFDTQNILGVALWRKLFARKDDEEESEEETILKVSGENENQTTSETDPKNQTNNKTDPAKPETKPGETKNKNGESGLFGTLPFLGKKSRLGNFTPPPLSLLEPDSGKPNAGDIKGNANIIKRTLANFGITVEMDEVSIGPTVTRYALKPAEGVKLSRIVALQNDLSLSLAAHPLRIEAPIPGRSLVGIEIPNKVKATIRLASLLATQDYNESHHPLYIALGRDITGAARFANLSKAPHMLIAGATGSGKSVTIHSVITSLLYRNAPEQMRFVLIDPKRVELTLYNKIPHLLTPVITEPKKAIAALRWLAKEMDRRYDILEAETVRDIQSYHKNIVEPALAKSAAAPTDKEGEENGEEIERMPYIVVIIDELADIMTAFPRELEAAIVRLAQMSRAVGIHLILSTQRPSVDVITGLIKANIPSRVAMQVASQIDSRTILDMAGAEKLLGAGDMLYISGEMSKPVRLQSAFITEEEVKKVSNYLADQYADLPPAELNLAAEEALSGGGRSSSGLAIDFAETDADDDLYEDAREAVMEAGKASASYLQRKLKVGYARAARLLDMLEERGVIGPGDGAKAREVYGRENVGVPTEETQDEL